MTLSLVNIRQDNLPDAKTFEYNEAVYGNNKTINREGRGMKKKIGVIVGSLRKASWNQKLAQALISLAPASLDLELLEIADLPLYNQDDDDENHPPKAWQVFREKAKAKEGFLFVSPEYNRSIPAPLKNAIDVGSRPYGQSVWGKKPGAVISASIGAMGGFGANQHLRQTFVFLDIWCMQQPEAYIATVQDLFNEAGALSNEKTKAFLSDYMKCFEAWVQKLTT